MYLQLILNASKQKFLQSCTNKNFTVQQSSKLEDIHEHWDFKVNNSTVDVKALKRINRSESMFSTEYTQDELQNVRGNTGWLFGDADYIAFEQLNHFLIVKRSDLIGFCEKNIKDQFVDRASQAIYKKYQRKNRQDIISLISLKDLVSDVKVWRQKF